METARISNVRTGQKITALKQNEIINAVNLLNATSYDTPYSTLILSTVSHLPWKVDEYSLSVYRPEVLIGLSTVEANYLSDQISSLPEILSSQEMVNFYACVPTSCVNSNDSIDVAWIGWDDILSTYPLSDCYTIHTFTSYGSQLSSLSVEEGEDPTYYSGPFGIQYYNICPTFATNGGGEPYGVFRFTGNTGTISVDEDPAKPCGTFSMCNFTIGRNSASMNDVSGIYDVKWYLRLDHKTLSTEVLPSSSPLSALRNTLYQTCLPICEIKNQQVVNDYRSLLQFQVYN